jgi:hypothetical protein
MRAISTGRPRFEGDGSKARRRNHGLGRSSTDISCRSNVENQGNRFERTGFTRRCWLADPTQSITTCVPARLIETTGAGNQALLSRNSLSAPAVRPLRRRRGREPYVMPRMVGVATTASISSRWRCGPHMPVPDPRDGYAEMSMSVRRFAAAISILRFHGPLSPMRALTCVVLHYRQGS